MGWFSSPSSSGSTGSSSSSSSGAGPVAAPTRGERQACWGARDAYFACLTSANVVVPPGTDMSDGRAPASSAADAAKAAAKTEQARERDPCKPERAEYERHCARSWVDYFNKRRILEERQKRMYANTQGAAPAPAANAK